ncbi:hypothetical protein EsH8_VIII_000330 [Colletotrichum jinshuiense]
MSPTSIALALLAAAEFAAAQGFSQDPVTRYHRNAFGPYFIEGDVWASYFDDPDYSAYYPIDGPDVSGPYPGGGTGSWSVSVAVQNGIPLREARESQVNGADRDKFIAGTRVTLNPPTELLTDNDDDDDEAKWPMDKSWRICYSQFSFSTNSAQMQSLTGDDGSCGTLWDEACLRAIEESISEEWARNSRDHCPFTIPRGCSPTNGSGWTALHNSIWGDELEAWRARDSGVGGVKGVQVLAWGSQPGEEDDEGNLQRARGFVTPLIIAFAPDERSDARENKPVVRIVCPRAKEEGEVEVESDGAALGVRGGLLVLALVFGFAFCLC